jgi:AcrR family transcriptional regulator
VNGPARRVYGGRSAEQRRRERRERLLAAGLELFGTEGYPAVSIERLCAAARVSTRTFYEEFAGREWLLVALHEQIAARAAEALQGALAAAGSQCPAARLAAAVRAYLQTTCADPRWARICHVEVLGAGAAVERQRLAWRDRLAVLLAAEAGRAAAGRGEAPGRDHLLPAIGYLGAVTELVQHWSAQRGEVPLELVCTELIRLAVTLLATP